MTVNRRDLVCVQVFRDGRDLPSGGGIDLRGTENERENGYDEQQSKSRTGTHVGYRIDAHQLRDRDEPVTEGDR